MKTMRTVLGVVVMFVTVGLFAQDLVVNTKKSTIKWHGEKVTGEHFGTIDLKKGTLVWKNNKIESGEMIVDMTSIENTDIEDPGYNAKLVNHLKSDDFFGVEKHPVATLKIKSSSAFKDNKAKVKGDLTIKGITHPVEFEAQKENNWFMADIIIDRSKYDVRYGSGSFFDNLGDKTIYDEFTLTVKLATMAENTADLK